MQIIPPGKKLVLASRSPRRQKLLKDLGISFEVRTQNADEVYPTHLQGKEIAEYLARLKAGALISQLRDNEIVLTSDTIVWCDGESLTKAQNEAEAREMLQKLSGKSHEVITGVCLASVEKQEVFSDTVRVYFRLLSDEEINYYIRNYEPYDKAGAYGIQEWIGMTGITKIEGSYFTVMGLPTHMVWEKLQKF